MDIVGVVWVKINGRFAITLTNWTADKSTPTKVHKGGFGAFGVSQGPADYAGTFKVSVPATGLEFDFDGEFGGPNGGKLQVSNPQGTYKRGFSTVKISKRSEVTDEANGTTEVTYNWVAQKEVPL